MTHRYRVNGKEVSAEEFANLPSRFSEIAEQGRLPAIRTPDSWGLENGGKGRQFLDQPGQPHFENRSDMERWADRRYGRGQWSLTPVEEIKHKHDNRKPWKPPKLTDYLE